MSKVKLDDVVIRKPVDKASPRLAEAHETQARLSGEFQFFRVDDTGTSNHFFTGGRVRWRDIYLPDLAAAAGRGTYGVSAPYEEIGLRLSRVSGTYEDGDISFGG